MRIVAVCQNPGNTITLKTNWMKKMRCSKKVQKEFIKMKKRVKVNTIMKKKVLKSKYSSMILVKRLIICLNKTTGIFKMQKI